MPLLEVDMRVSRPCRHKQFEDLNCHFDPLMVGKYESAYIMIDEEDLNRKFKKWMNQNIDNLSSIAAQNFINDVLFPEIPPGVLASYGLNAKISASFGWKALKKCGGKSEAYQQGYFNDHHDCELQCIHPSSQSLFIVYM